MTGSASRSSRMPRRRTCCTRVPQTLVAAARVFVTTRGFRSEAGGGERYLFSPDFSQKLAEAFRSGGETAICRVAGFGQRRGLAGGDGERPQARRACAGHARQGNNALCGLVWMYPRHRDLGRAAGGIALGSRQKRKLIEVSVRLWFP